MSADRTLMSVIRTSLSLIGFGFTIFQFFPKDARSGGAEEQRSTASLRRSVGMTRSGDARHWQEALLSGASDTLPNVRVAPTYTWALMYKSGTTGKPKGAVRNHQGRLLYIVTQVIVPSSRQPCCI